MKTLCCQDYRQPGTWCSRCDVGDPANCQDRWTQEPNPPVPTAPRRRRPMRIIVKILIGLAAWHTLLALASLGGPDPENIPFAGHAALASLYLAMAAIGYVLLRRNARSRL